jgi:hypothetical protein
MCFCLCLCLCVAKRGDDQPDLADVEEEERDRVRSGTLPQLGVVQLQP